MGPWALWGERGVVVAVIIQKMEAKPSTHAWDMEGSGGGSN